RFEFWYRESLVNYHGRWRKRRGPVTQISIFRTSFIWTETVPAILSQTVPADAPCAFLGRFGDYASKVNTCQKTPPADGSLKLPWETPGNFYWQHYFEGQAAETVTGVQGWKKIVPFVLNLASTTVTADAEARVTFEILYAPQGVAAIARVNYR